MVKILSLLVLSVFLFVGGLAASLYLRPMLNPEEQLEETPVSANSGTTGTNAVEGAANAAPPAAELPVPFHGKPLSTDDVFRLTAALRGREREIKRREAALEQKESRLKMVEEDLRGQRHELEGLLEKVQDVYERTTLAYQRVQQERAGLRSDTDHANQTIQEAKRIQSSYDSNQLKNQTQLAQVVEEMDEVSAAQYLKNLANSGQIGVAAYFLSSMETRNAAKIIDVLEPDLQKQLTDAMLNRPPPPPTPQRR